jgi:hypothetical protein
MNDTAAIRDRRYGIEPASGIIVGNDHFHPVERNGLPPQSGNAGPQSLKIVIMWDNDRNRSLIAVGATARRGPYRILLADHQLNFRACVQHYRTYSNRRSGDAALATDRCRSVAPLNVPSIRYRVPQALTTDPGRPTDLGRVEV